MGSAERLQFHIQAEEGYVVIEIIGEIDLYTLKKAEFLFSSIEKRGIRYWIVSLEKSGYLDSSGISLLITYHKMCEKKDGKFIVICNNNSILRILQTARIDKIIHIVPNLMEARTEMKDIMNDSTQYLKRAKKLLSEGKTDECIKVVDLAAEKFSDNFDILFFAAELYTIMKNHEKALGFAERAYDIDHQDEGLMLVLAEIYSNSERIDEAKKLYEKVAAGKDPKKVMKAKEKLEFIAKITPES